MDSKMLNVWSQVLDVDPSDLDEDTNFFEAGTDSAVIRLVATAQAVNISVDIEDVLNHPNLGELTTISQEINHASKPKENAGETSILDQDTVGECATACLVEGDARGHLPSVASPYGTYMLQWSFPDMWGARSKSIDGGLGSAPEKASNHADQACPNMKRLFSSRLTV